MNISVLQDALKQARLQRNDLRKQVLTSVIGTAQTLKGKRAGANEQKLVAEAIQEEIKAAQIQLEENRRYSRDAGNLDAQLQELKSIETDFNATVAPTEPMLSEDELLKLILPQIDQPMGDIMKSLKGNARVDMKQASALIKQHKTP